MSDETANLATQDEVTYDLNGKEQPIKLRGKDGVVRPYTLREPDGLDRDKYLTFITGKYRVGPDGKPTGIKDATGMESRLISMMLYDENNKLVPEKVIQSWPSGVQTGLFKDCFKLAGLDQTPEQAREAAKNE